MRVLNISHAYTMPINRDKLAALARRPGLEVFLFAPSNWKEGAREYVCEEGREDGFRVFTGPVIFNGRIGGHVYRRGLGKACRLARPDIVHLEAEPYSLAAAQVLFHLFRKRTRPRLIVFSWENLDAHIRWYARIIEKVVLRRADMLLAGGKTSRERLLRLGAAAEKVRTLHQFGLAPDLYRPPGPGERGETFTVGYVGRLVLAKGVDIFLKALAGLGGEWRAQVVGGGEEREALEQLALSLGIGERVEFVGWLDHFEVPRYLRKWHVLSLPSRTTEKWAEQFGRVLMEAMSSGVVPVGSDSGEIPFVIGGEGFTFPENDDEALRKVLQRLKDDPRERERLAEAGRKRALTEFTWEALAERTHSLYEEVLENQQGGV